MAPLTIAKRMEQVIRGYIEACNHADAAAISACFLPDAVHYAPGIPKWSGAAAIGGNFAKRVAETGQWWTVDQLVTDADRCAAVLEWTRFDPSRRQILRGMDWFPPHPLTPGSASAPTSRPASSGQPHCEREHLGGVVMSDEPQTREEHYRDIAEKIRELTRQTHISQVREELYDLADRLDRMGTRREEEQEP